MNYESNKARQELQDWIEAQNFTIFGTLKFTSGTLINPERSDKIICGYFNALDRAYFGNATCNVGMRHPRLVFKQFGTSGTNIHYHFLARPINNPDLFAKLAQQQWAKMGSWTISAADTWIERVRSSRMSAAYILHEYGKMGADTLCLGASTLAAPPRCPRSFRNMAQLRRLLKLYSADQDPQELDERHDLPHLT